MTQEQGPLWVHVESQAVAGQLEVKLPRRGHRAARVAVLDALCPQEEDKAFEQGLVGGEADGLKD